MPILRGDPDLLRGFRAGDRAALARVYDAYVEPVGRLVQRGCRVRTGGQLGGELRVSAQDVLDVAQEVFLKAFSPSAPGLRRDPRLWTLPPDDSSRAT